MFKSLNPFELYNIILLKLLIYLYFYLQLLLTYLMYNIIIQTVHVLQYGPHKVTVYQFVGSRST